MSISPKAIIVGLIGIVAVVFIVSYAELVTSQIMIGFLQLPPVVIALLFLLVLANRWVASIRKGAELTAKELAIVYIMMLLASMIASRGLMEKLLPTLIGSNYLPPPAWKDVYYPHIKSWLVPFDVKGAWQQPIAKMFYEGLSFGESIPWHPWIRPLLVWTILIAFVFFSFICLSTILRRQWADNEKLSFPLVQLPLEMLNDSPGRPFFSNPVMWLGFLAPFTLFGINGLHNVFPAIPQIPISVDLHAFMTGRPWSAMSGLTAFFSLAGMGFFFLLPVDLLFSFWFFYLLSHAEEAMASAFGSDPVGAGHGAMTGMIDYQSIGAWIALAVYLFLLARPHLKKVMANAFNLSKGGDEDEVLSYRVAVWGLVFCMVGITVWGVVNGASWWLVLGEFTVFIFVQALIMARAVAEGGVIMTEGVMTPKDLYTPFVPLNSMGQGNLTALSFFDALFTRDMRGLTLTGFLDAQKLADGVKLERRKLLWVFILALIVAMVSSAALQLYLPYHLGANSMYSYEYMGNNMQFFRENQTAMGTLVPATPQWLFWLAVGIVMTILMVNLRIRLDWFPLHPLGYALTSTWTMTVFWFPILAAWILKSLVIRYGGMRFFVRIRPFFLGLVFGEFTAAVFWTLLSASFGVQAPTFPWP